MLEFLLSFLTGFVGGSIVAALSLALGFRMGWQTVRQRRSAHPDEDSLVSWDEKPIPYFRHDPVLAALLTGHSISVAACAVLALLAGSRIASSSPSWLPGMLWPVYCAVVYFFIALPWRVVGLHLVRPVVVLGKLPVRVALTEEGIHHGQAFLPWKLLGDLRHDAHSGLFRVFAYRTPGLVLLSTRPPSSKLAKKVHHVLDQKLSSQVQRPEPGWYHRKAVFALLFAATSLPFAIAGLWFYQSSCAWSLPFNCLASLLVAQLGHAVIQGYSGISQE